MFSSRSWDELYFDNISSIKKSLSDNIPKPSHITVICQSLSVWLSKEVQPNGKEKKKKKKKKNVKKNVDKNSLIYYLTPSFLLF